MESGAHLRAVAGTALHRCARADKRRRCRKARSVASHAEVRTRARFCQRSERDRASRPVPRERAPQLGPGPAAPPDDARVAARRRLPPRAVLATSVDRGLADRANQRRPGRAVLRARVRGGRAGGRRRYQDAGRPGPSHGVPRQGAPGEDGQHGAEGAAAPPVPAARRRVLQALRRRAARSPPTGGSPSYTRSPSTTGPS